MVQRSEIKQLTVYIVHYLECEHAGVNGVKYQRSTIQGSVAKPNQQIFQQINKSRGAESEQLTAVA